MLRELLDLVLTSQRTSATSVWFALRRAIRQEIDLATTWIKQQQSHRRLVHLLFCMAPFGSAESVMAAVVPPRHAGPVCFVTIARPQLDVSLGSITLPLAHNTHASVFTHLKQCGHIPRSHRHNDWSVLWIQLGESWYSLEQLYPAIVRQQVRDGSVAELLTTFTQHVILQAAHDECQTQITQATSMLIDEQVPGCPPQSDEVTLRVHALLPAHVNPIHSASHVETASTEVDENVLIDCLPALASPHIKNKSTIQPMAALKIRSFSEENSLIAGLLVDLASDVRSHYQEVPECIAPIKTSARTTTTSSRSR